MKYNTVLLNLDENPVTKNASKQFLELYDCFSCSCKLILYVVCIQIYTYDQIYVNEKKFCKTEKSFASINTVSLVIFFGF